MARKSSKSTFGTVEKRGHNSYRIKWTDKDGVRRSESVKGPRIAADDRLAEIRLGMISSKRSATYSSYWNETVRPSLTGLAPKTVADYEWTWDAKLSKAIGGMTISDTDWRVVQNVMDGIRPSGVQRKCFVLWRKINNMAVRDGLMQRNPCDRSIRLAQHVKRRKVLLDAEYVKEWMSKIEGFKHEVAILCMIGGGLRPEEARALSYDDIQEWTYRGVTYAKVRINKTVVVAGGEVVEQSKTKTALSNRDVVIGDPFASRILELSIGGEGRVCDNGRGGVTSPETMARSWKLWCERRDMVFVTCENLRSSYSTLQGEAGSIDSLVSFGMGHSDGTTKGKNYQQATLRGLALIADNLTEYLAAENWDNSGTIVS